MVSAFLLLLVYPRKQNMVGNMAINWNTSEFELPHHSCRILMHRDKPHPTFLGRAESLLVTRGGLGRGIFHCKKMWSQNI